MEEYDHINDNSALLKELGLLNDGESLRKRRLADYATLNFFDYEQCFAFPTSMSLCGYYYRTKCGG